MNSKGPGNHLIEETRNKDEVCLEGIRECGYHQKGKFTPFNSSQTHILNQIPKECYLLQTFYQSNFPLEKGPTTVL